MTILLRHGLRNSDGAWSLGARIADRLMFGATITSPYRGVVLSGNAAVGSAFDMEPRFTDPLLDTRRGLWQYTCSLPL